MSKLQNFFQNPFNKQFETVKEAGQSEAANRTTKQANELFKDKPFATENKTTFIISNIIKYIANIVSFATAFFALRAVLSLTVGIHIASGGALLLCGLIELLKNSSWKTNVKGFLRYKKVSFLGLGVLLLLSLLSIGASLYGAYLLPSELTAPTQITYSKNDSLVINELATINTQIANLDKLALETSAKAIPNKDGKISSTIKTILASYAGQKDSLSSQKRAINAQIASLGENYQARDKEAIQAHKNSIYTAQLSCLIVALLFELIYTICAVYGFYYLFRVYVDSNPQPTPTPTNTDQQSPPAYEPTNQPTQHTPTNQAPQIGFKHYPPTDIQTTDNNPPTNPHTNQTNQVPTDIPNGFTTVLQPFENGLVGTENGIKFVWHKNKKYTKSDINNNVYAFRTKCNNYEKLADFERLRKYKEHLQTWENYLGLVTAKA